MKLKHKNFVRKFVAAAVAVAALTAFATCAFAAEGEEAAAAQPAAGDDATVVGYLPPMPWDQMIQGDIMLLSAEGDTPVETAAPAGEETAEKVPVAAGLTMTGPFWKEVLFTARQDGRVLTLSAPEDSVTVKGTIGDLRAQMNQGVGTLTVMTNKTTTTLNLTLMCDGYSDSTRFTLRQIGSRSYLTIGGRCRRDLVVGR